MEVSFAKNVPSVAPAAAIDVPSTATPVPTPAPAAPAPAPASSVPACTTGCKPPAKTSLVLGDKIPSFDDIILPRLNLVQNMGELKDSFPLGAIVFNQTTVLFTPPVINAKTSVQEKPGTAPVIITCLGFRDTRFVEKTADGVRGMIVKTEEAVAANGGTLDYREWELKKADGMKYFQALAEALVAIERPEICADDDTVFVYPVNGKKYALALWGMKGTSYTEAAKKVFFTSRFTGCLRAGYPSRSFAFSTRWKTYGGTKGSHIPVLIPQQPSSPEFLAWVTGVLNPGEAPAAEAAE